jgi:hypothetical protein
MLQRHGTKLASLEANPVNVTMPREWFIRMVAKDFNGELEQIDRELEAELSR